MHLYRQTFTVQYNNNKYTIDVECRYKHRFLVKTLLLYSQYTNIINNKNDQHRFENGIFFFVSC